MCWVIYSPIILNFLCSKSLHGSNEYHMQKDISLVSSYKGKFLTIREMTHFYSLPKIEYSKIFQLSITKFCSQKNSFVDNFNTFTNNLLTVGAGKILCTDQKPSRLHHNPKGCLIPKGVWLQHRNSQTSSEWLQICRRQMG
jgi:hypothetical protein